jgi:hypothetical protein
MCEKSDEEIRDIIDTALAKCPFRKTEARWAYCMTRVYKPVWTSRNKRPDDPIDPQTGEPEWVDFDYDDLKRGLDEMKARFDRLNHVSHLVAAKLGI